MKVEYFLSIYINILYIYILLFYIFQYKINIIYKNKTSYTVTTISCYDLCSKNFL